MPIHPIRFVSIHSIRSVPIDTVCAVSIHTISTVFAQTINNASIRVLRIVVTVCVCATVAAGVAGYNKSRAAGRLSIVIEHDVDSRKSGIEQYLVPPSFG